MKLESNGKKKNLMNKIVQSELLLSLNECRVSPEAKDFRTNGT